LKVERHEGPSERSSNLWELQDRTPQGHRARHLHEHQAQAEARI